MATTITSHFYKCSTVIVKVKSRIRMLVTASDKVSLFTVGMLFPDQTVLPAEYTFLTWRISDQRTHSMHNDVTVDSGVKFVYARGTISRVGFLVVGGRNWWLAGWLTVSTSEFLFYSIALSVHEWSSERTAAAPVAVAATFPRGTGRRREGLYLC